MLVATREQIRRIEQRAMASGLSEGRLMENAGTAAAREIRRLSGVPQSTVVLCGNGNNGGDGFVIARKLAEYEYPVAVLLCCGEPRTVAAAEAFSKLHDLQVFRLEDDPVRAATMVSTADLVVDAVYGIGFRGDLPQTVADLFAHVGATARRVAVDIPSGMECDSGRMDDKTFRATDTVSFILAKPAHITQACAAACGRLQVVSIGVADEDIEAVLTENVLRQDDIAACFTPRAANSHKGTYGHLLAICGSVGMAGAAILSARAALRSGVGLLTVALPRSVYPIVSAAVPEAVCLPLPETEQGTLSETALPALLKAGKRATAVLIGCGMGLCADTELLTCELIQRVGCPVIADADGINALARHIHILETVATPLVLTPHPGEMARLIGKTVADVQADRVSVATAFAAEYPLTLVLKGHRTVIADGERYTVNPTGNPGMATGGSGDVLAGMIASFAAQGMPVGKAAECGVFLHGRAGDIAARKYSQHAMLPSDLIDQLGELFLQLE